MSGETVNSQDGPRCAVCGASGLLPHLRVAGEAGADGLVPTTDRFGTALADIVRCPACSHMQLDPMPSTEDLRESYEDAESIAYVDEEAGQRATADAVLASLERHVRPGGLLDLGCWVGFLLSEAEARGWRGTGVEPSAFASAFARDRLGLDVQTGDLLTVALPSDEYRAVVLGDVIEHLPAPSMALGRIAETLEPGGILVLMLPDAGSRLARIMGKRWWSVIPTHVHYFTRASIARVLTDSGFSVLSIESQPKAFTVRYYLDRIGGYSPGIARTLVAGSRRLGTSERIWAPDFRDRMLVMAQAPKR